MFKDRSLIPLLGIIHNEALTSSSQVLTLDRKIYSLVIMSDWDKLLLAHYHYDNERRINKQNYHYQIIML